MENIDGGGAGRRAVGRVFLCRLVPAAWGSGTAVVPVLL